MTLEKAVPLWAYGKRYEARPKFIRSGVYEYDLATDGRIVGHITRISPHELELRSSSGYYRVNGATLEVLAKRHYEDITGMMLL